MKTKYYIICSLFLVTMTSCSAPQKRPIEKLNSHIVKVEKENGNYSLEEWRTANIELNKIVDNIDANYDKMLPAEHNVALKANKRYNGFNNIKTEDGLIFIIPNFSRIDLVCGTMPSPNDTSVILVAEAAYTGKCINQFYHTNIAGDHVSGGKRYKGYRCVENTGAFVYYNDNWKFCYKNYSNELDSATLYGGAAFAQELIIKDNELLTTPRNDSNKNIFRALCELSGKLCIVESDTVVTFGTFKRKLIESKVENAIYLDMGSGWNHAWYRTSDSIVELHPKTHNYCTNWITFYE